MCRNDPESEFRFATQPIILKAWQGGDQVSIVKVAS